MFVLEIAIIILLTPISILSLKLLYFFLKMEQLTSNVQPPPLPGAIITTPDDSNLAMMKDRLISECVITEQDAEKKV